MTKRRYFYTDALAASWMAKHFEMAFTSSEGELLYITGGSITWGGGGGYTGRCYIHRESLPLLQPQAGDYVAGHNHIGAVLLRKSEGVYTPIILTTYHHYFHSAEEMQARGFRIIH